MYDNVMLTDAGGANPWQNNVLYVMYCPLFIVLIILKFTDVIAAQPSQRYMSMKMKDTSIIDSGVTERTPAS